MGSAFFNGFGDIGCVGFSTLFEFDHPWKLNGTDRKVSKMQMPVDGRFGNTEVVGLQDVIEVLPLIDALRNDGIDSVKLLLV